MVLNIRHLTVADIEAINPVHMAAYGTTSSFKSELELLLALQPDGWLIAEYDGVPVGMVGAVKYGTFAYIGLLGVHPAFQSRRIGRTLMERILAWLEEQSCSIAVLDATPAGVPLYTKLGFVEEEKSLLLRQDTPEHNLKTFDFVSELRVTDLAEIVAFDTPLFGCDRQTVLTTFFNTSPSSAYIVRNPAQQIVGYIFAQPQKFGPWAANTLEVAEALLSKALQLPFINAPRVLVPGSNSTAIELLKRYGFSEQRSLSHMYRGKSPVIRQRCKQYGMASFALG